MNVVELVYFHTVDTKDMQQQDCSIYLSFSVYLDFIYSVNYTNRCAT
jgi:hypothetical protein